MFRKVLNIMLVVSLLITTIGFTVSKHYCGDRFVSFSINSDAVSCCDDETGNCCHNESDFFQFDEEFVITYIQINLKNSFLIDLAFISSLPLHINSGIKNTDDFLFFSTIPPPPKLETLLATLQVYLL